MNAAKRLVLVTGASGFLGKPMVRALAARRLGGTRRFPRSGGDPGGGRRRARRPAGPREGRGLGAARGRCDAHRASRRHRARAGPSAGGRLQPHQPGRGRGACQRRTRRRRALRADVLGAGASRACRGSCHHRSGPAASHRHLWPIQARSRASAGRERRSLHRAPPGRGLWTRRQRQYREPRYAGANADAASLRRARQSPLASRDRQSRIRPSSSRSPRPRPKARCSSSPTASRSASPTSSPPCAKGLAAPLICCACRPAR